MTTFHRSPWTLNQPDVDAETEAFSSRPWSLVCAKRQWTRLNARLGRLRCIDSNNYVRGPVEQELEQELEAGSWSWIAHLKRETRNKFPLKRITYRSPRSGQTMGIDWNSICSNRSGQKVTVFIVNTWEIHIRGLLQCGGKQFYRKSDMHRRCRCRCRCTGGDLAEICRQSTASRPSTIPGIQVRLIATGRIVLPY